MNKDFFEYVPEGLAIIDENYDIICSNIRFKSHFGNIKKLTDLVLLDRKTRGQLPAFEFDKSFNNPLNDMEALYVNENNADLWKEMKKGFASHLKILQIFFITLIFLSNCITE